MACNGKTPEKPEKRLQIRKIISRRPPFLCKVPSFFRQKQSVERRMVCKVLPLYGLSTVQTHDDRRIRKLRNAAKPQPKVNWPQKIAKIAKKNDISSYLCVLYVPLWQESC
jgi:hypothetical protein